MLTLFAIPKAFEGHIGIIQRNAIKSWTLLKPRPEIILFGNESGTSEICKESHLRHISHVRQTACSTPLVNALFEDAQKLSDTDLMCYINSDIILMDDFISAIEKIPKPIDKFLLIARRWEVEIRELLNYDEEDWKAQLYKHAVTSGRRGGGSDFFVFSKGLYKEIPPFSLGRGYWDPWLIWNARKGGVPVFDATNITNPIHQNHAYAFQKEGQNRFDSDPEVRRNFQLNGGWRYFFQYSIPTHRLLDSGVQKVPLIHYFFHIYLRLKAYLVGLTYSIRRKMGLYRWWIHK